MIKYTTKTMTVERILRPTYLIHLSTFNIINAILNKKCRTRPKINIYVFPYS